MKDFPCIEPLESRIAPAIILNPTTVTYQDGSGQTAVVKISHPLFTSNAAAEKILQFDTGGFGNNSVAQNLNEINLLGRGDANGMNISVTVVPQVNGPNTVDVGFIAAADFSNFGEVTQNINLGNITIQGDLGGITAGGNLALPGAIQSLNVLSMNEGESSDILGTIKSLHVANDFSANLQLIGFQFGKINNLYIGGSLTGSASGGTASGVTPGEIVFTGSIGSATIGNIVGSSAQDSGSLVGNPTSNSSIGSLHVLGSVSGGSGLNSGEVSTTVSIGKITIDGNLQGGTAGNASSTGESGFITTGHLGSLTIAGALIGGNQGAPVMSTSGTKTTTQPDPNQTASFSGAVLVNSAGSITIGSIQGGSGVSSGLVEALGSLGKVVVTGDIKGGTAGTGSDSTGTAGNSGAIIGLSASSISVGGALTGGSPSGDAVTTVDTSTNPSTTTSTPAHTANFSGAILVNTASSISVGNGVHGGGGFESGVISGDSLSPSASASVGKITITGDVAGGAGANSGSILPATIPFFGTGIPEPAKVQSIQVSGNLTGGSGSQSGEISVASLATLAIGGNVSGGTANVTGAIFVSGSLGTATIGGSLFGGIVNSSSDLMDSGYVEAGHIGTMKVGQGVFAYDNAGSGGIYNSGAIRSNSDIVSLEIDGTVQGVSNNPVIISAVEGPVVAHQKTDVAIGSLTVKGDISYSRILAGYGPSTSAGAQLGVPQDGSAQMGNILVTGNLTDIDIAAGAQHTSGTTFGASTGNTPITGGVTKSGILSTIASIIVDGTATGDTNTGTFGFEAEYLTAVTVNGVAVPLKAGPENDTTPVNISGNLYALEVAPA